MAFDPYAIRDQIGFMNMLSISGGRWFYDSEAKAVTMPVGSGYKVIVRYDEGSDTYIVQRIHVRRSVVTLKREVCGIMASELGQTAYRMSLFI